MTNQPPTRPTPMPRLLTLPGLLLAASVAASAQAPVLPPMNFDQPPSTTTTSPINYDVISIRPHKPGDSSMSWRNTADSFSVVNLSLKQLLVNAYGIREALIAGLPAWTESATYDINAKLSDPDLDALKKLTPAQRRAMIAQVLVDRFGLKVHTEIKQLPVYELTLAKDGPRFKEYLAPPAPPADPNPDPAAPRPAPRMGGPGSMSTGRGRFSATAIPLSTLNMSLANETSRNIIDKTGLTGKYNFELRWTPDDAPTPMLNGQPDPNPPPPLFTALQEQLGLKLVSARGPVETLVVDHITPPTEN